MVNIIASMATWSSDLGDQKSKATIQMKGHTLTPLNIWNGPKEMEESDSIQSHSPSQSSVRRQAPDCPETQYCLEIQVILTKDYTTTPTCLASPSGERHAPRWQIWPNRSCSDGLRPGHSVLWKVISRRQTQLEWGVWCHIHTIRSH